jgi:hypothetical protein
MAVTIQFNEAAFRHGVSEEDIRQAIATQVYDTAMSGLPEKYVIVGFDRNGNPLEIMYNPMDNDTMNVFHAMKARKTFIAQLNLRR